MCRRFLSFYQGILIPIFFKFSFFKSLFFLSLAIGGNVFGLCVRAGFGAQNCQSAILLNRSTKLQVCSSPRLTQNPCYAFAFLSLLKVFCHASNVLSAMYATGTNIHCPVLIAYKIYDFLFFVC